MASSHENETGEGPSPPQRPEPPTPAQLPLYGQLSLPNKPTRRALRKRLISTLFPCQKAQHQRQQHNAPYYSPSIADRIEASSAFLGAYTGLNNRQLQDHVHSIRDRAWAIEPYPSFGLGWFLLPGLSETKSWPDIVLEAKEGKTILDVGSGLGQELRRLRLDAGLGTKTNLYATDACRELWSVGCDLFLDRDKARPEFLLADARLRASSGKYASFGPRGSLEKLRGKVDIILISGLLEFFNYSDQVAIAETVALLSRAGTKVVGRCFGTDHLNERDYKEVGDREFSRFLNSWVSLLGIWNDAANHTGIKWNVNVETVGLEEWGLGEGDLSWMTVEGPLKGLDFVVVRET
ncbi:hypothetical protein N7532_010633 [Penicillium argentinense]|uniref:Methyltransferase domain-containing protein n=1 Tax=Penicillium argentinense TaxID=1131581 RepID=A0A9W9JYS0_9EURO|nr:uncharacterized protein N7532_010633 [Penicillium argentinense]KAJ5085862.1 hypothetical protein N7532_010633 [Penicillium argentinense]